MFSHIVRQWVTLSFFVVACSFFLGRKQQMRRMQVKRAKVGFSTQKRLQPEPSLKLCHHLTFSDTKIKTSVNNFMACNWQRPTTFQRSLLYLRLTTWDQVCSKEEPRAGAAGKNAQKLGRTFQQLSAQRLANSSANIKDEGLLVSYGSSPL